MYEFLLSHLGPRLSRRPPSALQSTVIQQKIPEFLGRRQPYWSCVLQERKTGFILLHYCSPQIVVAD